MFNFKLHAKSAQVPYEKYHRNENVGPKADDNDPIAEKTLTHRNGYEQTITEDQMKDRKAEGDAQVVEKLLESTTSKYVTHRSDAAELTVPPISALVEKIRQGRASDREESKKSHWSQTFDEKKQQGSLPKWSKNVPQDDKPALNNDPRRFSGSKDGPTDFHEDKIQPLIGGLTMADVRHVADAIKSGQAKEYDNAMGAILRLAHEEGRELTSIERKTVVNLKIARTNILIKNAQVD